MRCAEILIDKISTIAPDFQFRLEQRLKLTSGDIVADLLTLSATEVCIVLFLIVSSFLISYSYSSSSLFINILYIYAMEVLIIVYLLSSLTTLFAKDVFLILIFFMQWRFTFSWSPSSSLLCSQYHSHCHHYPKVVRQGCLKIHMVDFDCKMGHGSNQDQLRNVMMIVDESSMIINDDDFYNIAVVSKVIVLQIMW